METQEERTQSRKTERDCKMRKRLFETQEESAKRKKTKRDCMAKQRQTETEEQGAKRKKTKRDCMAKQQQTETEEQGAKRKKTNRDCLRRKREEMRYQLKNDRRDVTERIWQMSLSCNEGSKTIFTQNTGSSKPPYA